MCCSDLSAHDGSAHPVLQQEWGSWTLVVYLLAFLLPAEWLKVPPPGPAIPVPPLGAV